MSGVLKLNLECQGEAARRALGGTSLARYALKMDLGAVGREIGDATGRARAPGHPGWQRSSPQQPPVKWSLHRTSLALEVEAFAVVFAVYRDRGGWRGLRRRRR